MSRFSRHPISPTSVFVAAIVLAFVFALLPLKYAGWLKIHRIGDLADTMLTPISDPAAKVSRWLAPASRARQAEPEELRTLQDQIDTLSLQLARERAEVVRLNRLIEQLQGGIALNPDLPVRLLAAPIVGSSSDLTSGLLKVRAGTAQGVAPNTVAVVDGVHLMGRIVSASPRTSVVEPITNRGAGPIRGRVILSDSPSDWPICELHPGGDGTLSGVVEDRRTDPDQLATPVAVGQTVRLDDPAWPRSSRMLIIGLVTEVGSAPGQELRKIITVEPTVRLDRVAEIILRITEEAEEGGEG